jgi:hypothetical protein
MRPRSRRTHEIKQKTPKTLALLDRVMILIYNVDGKEENSLHNFEVALVYEILISSVWTAYTSRSHQVSHAHLSFIWSHIHRSRYSRPAYTSLGNLAPNTSILVILFLFWHVFKHKCRECKIIESVIPTLIIKLDWSHEIIGDIYIWT